MHYIKCNNCGHLNEVKSEYLIFCSNCDKKIENNFRDWEKRNPGKSFEDFKQLMCVSELDLQQTSTNKNSRPKGLKYWIGFAVAFAIVYAIGSFGGEAIVKFFNSEKTAKEVLENEWITDTYGELGLTVTTPIKMTKSDLPIPDNVRQVIEQMDIYDHMSEKGFKIMISSVKYNSSIGQINLQGAADGSISEMKLEKGVSDFNYTEENVQHKNISGFKQKGTYNQNGIVVEFINMGFSKGLIFWQVFVAYQIDDEVGRIAAKRVIDSIVINENKI